MHDSESQCCDLNLSSESPLSPPAFGDESDTEADSEAGPSSGKATHLSISDSLADVGNIQKTVEFF